MTVGDWIALAAIVVPLAYAYWVDRRAQRSARAADDRARHAQQTADGMRLSLDSIATSIAEIAAASATGVHARTTAPLAPRWNIEPAEGESFVLRNVGSAPATNVRAQSPEPGVVVRDLPTGLDLRPVEGHAFFLTGSPTSGPVPHLVVSCDELGSVQVTMPPR